MKLSLVIVNSDGCTDTLACIAALYATPPACTFEIILVDNCSQDGCVAQVQTRYPDVRIGTAPARQGFAKNYNQGMHLARGDYLLVLNNDTLVPAGALDTLCALLDSHPEYGMVGPQLRNARGQVQWDCARPFPTVASFLAQALLLDTIPPLATLWRAWLRQRTRTRPTGVVACICGAAMLVRRQAIADAGMFDEAYVFYYEDVEWCHRLSRTCWQIGYCANVRITHLGDQSLGRVKLLAKRSEFASALRYFRSYHGLGERGIALCRAAMRWSYLMRAVLFLLRRGLGGRPGYAREYLYLWHELHTGEH